MHIDTTLLQQMSAIVYYINEKKNENKWTKNKIKAKIQ